MFLGALGQFTNWHKASPISLPIQDNRTMNSKVKQLILDAAVEQINNEFYEKMMDTIQETMTDAMVSVLGDTVDFDKDETFEALMELCGRIAIVGLPE
jgi:hypothetical protein